MDPAGLPPRLRAAARWVALGVNTPLARRRLHRDLSALERPIALEIGGRNPRAGWLVTDVHPRSRYHLDAAGTWPFEDGALALIYADNVLEHLGLPAAQRCFAEAHRCLRVGGRIRLVTPDIRKHVDLYLAGTSGLDGPVADRYRGIGLTVEHPVDLVRIAIAEFGHHLGYAWDGDALIAELRRAGFSSAGEVPVGVSDEPRLHGLELRTGPGQAQLAVEAVR